MTQRPLLLLFASVLVLCGCDDLPPEPSSSSSPVSSLPSPSVPVPPPATETPPARVIGDERCPAGQFFVHGGCHTGDSVGIAGPSGR